MVKAQQAEFFLPFLPTFIYLIWCLKKNGEPRTSPATKSGCCSNRPYFAFPKEDYPLLIWGASVETVTHMFTHLSSVWPACDKCYPESTANKHFPAIRERLAICLCTLCMCSILSATTGRIPAWIMAPNSLADEMEGCTWYYCYKRGTVTNAADEYISACSLCMWPKYDKENRLLMCHPSNETYFSLVGRWL